jgi:hypothetical protein
LGLFSNALGLHLAWPPQTYDAAEGELLAPRAASQRLLVKYVYTGVKSDAPIDPRCRKSYSDPDRLAEALATLKIYFGTPFNATCEDARLE